MADDDDAADAQVIEDVGVADEYPDHTGERPTGLEVTRRWTPRRVALTLGLVAAVSIASLCGWLGLRYCESEQINNDNTKFVQVARQGAINLTSVDHANVESDVERILDSATGTFYDDFNSRVEPFIEVVKQAQSKSEGTVLDAGLESVSGDEAQVLVAVRVTTVMADGAEQQPNSWRMRISVQRMGGDVKVSNVAFVP